MCGINGLISKNHIEEKDIDMTLKLMNTEIIHRGPDQDGIVINGRITLSPCKTDNETKLENTTLPFTLVRNDIYLLYKLIE